jgi:GxxExxY protein
MRTTEPTKKLFNVYEYYKMAEVGILRDDVRTELINGEIIEMSPMGARHASAVSRLTEFLVTLLKGKAQLRPQLPLRLNDYNEPEPDLCFVKPRLDHYGKKHPGSSDTLLAIEVSDSSLRYDRDVKSVLYATTRVPEFWIVHLKGDVLLVFRDPSKGQYKTSLTLHRGESVAPLAFPETETLTRQIVDAAARVHETLGPGFLESIYGRALLAELRERGLSLERERQIKIFYGGQVVGKHSLDLIVAGTAIVELKANQTLLPVHLAQLRSYLRATAYPFGLLLNFGTATLQWEVLHREIAG